MMLGAPSYARLEDARRKYEIVDIFRRPDLVPQRSRGRRDSRGAKVVGCNSPLFNEAAAEKPAPAGITA